MQLISAQTTTITAGTTTTDEMSSGTNKSLQLVQLMMFVRYRGNPACNRGIS